MHPEFFLTDFDDVAPATILAIAQSIRNCKVNYKEFEQLLDALNLYDDLKTYDDGIIQHLITALRGIRTKLLSDCYQLWMDKHAANSFVIDIRAGSGGADAQDLASIIVETYTYLLTKLRVDFQVVENHQLVIKDQLIFIQLLLSEVGIWKIIRNSPMSNKRHTSFLSISVHPIFQPQKISVQKHEIQVDTFRASGAGGQHVNKTDSAVRIKHIPSGITASSQSQRSQHQNKEEALNQLIKQLQKFYLEKELEIFNKKFINKVGIDRKTSNIRIITMYPTHRISVYGNNNLHNKELLISLEGKLINNILSIIRHSLSAYFSRQCC